MLVPLFAGGIYVLVVEPVVSAYIDTAREIADGRDELAHLQHLVALRPQLIQQVNALERRQDSNGYYLAGGTDALAAVALQDRVKEVAGSGGAAVRSMQPLAGTDQQGFRRVTVRVQLTATTDALFQVLYALEAGRPLVFVDNLDVQNRSVPMQYQDRDSSQPEDPTLVVAFDIYGYLPAGAK